MFLYPAHVAKDLPDRLISSLVSFKPYHQKPRLLLVGCQDIDRTDIRRKLISSFGIFTGAVDCPLTGEWRSVSVLDQKSLKLSLKRETAAGRWRPFVVARTNPGTVTVQLSPPVRI